MLTGFKNVKYGLQPGAKPKAKPPLQKLKAFADDDDSGGEEAPNAIGRDIARQAAKKQADKKVAEVHAAALAEDASVFDYDGVYDSIQEQRVKPKQQEKLARKSRYIEGLLDKAKERQREQDIIYERTLLKERTAEDHLFGDKERFVTAAYKAKLEADQKWMAEERIRDALEARHSVVKAGHMGNFYRNVLTNNEAFGTAAPKPAATPREEGAAAAEAGPSEGNAAVPPTKDAAFEAARSAREAYEAARERQGTSTQVANSGAATGAREGPLAAAGAAATEGASPRDERGPMQAPPARGTSADRDGRGGGGSAQEAAGADAGAGAEAGAEAEAAQKPAAAQKPEEDREAKAAAARERFLARKRKAPA